MIFCLILCALVIVVGIIVGRCFMDNLCPEGVVATIMVGFIGICACFYLSMFLWEKVPYIYEGTEYELCTLTDSDDEYIEIINQINNTSELEKTYTIRFIIRTDKGKELIEYSYKEDECKITVDATQKPKAIIYKGKKRSETLMDNLLCWSDHAEDEYIEFILHKDGKEE